MKKTARILYLIVGAIFPILIGGLHLWVHFQNLTTDTLRKTLDVPVLVLGAAQSAWSTWGVMSFMMGASFIIIGLLHLVILRKRGRDAFPPVWGIAIILLYLLAVVYVGATFGAPAQLYGGIGGLVAATICLFLTLSGKPKA